MLSLFSTRRFLPIFVTQFLGALNDNVLKNAFVMLVTFKIASERGWETSSVVNLITALLIFPMLIFSAFAGQLADRVEKASLIQKTKLGEVILMGIGALGFYWESISLLFLSIFLAGIQMAFFGPLKYGILPSHLKKNELMDGAAIFEAATFIAILLGTALGSWALDPTSTPPTIQNWVPVTIFIMGLLGWISSLFIPPAAPEKEKRSSLIFNPLRLHRDLIRHSSGNTPVWYSILGISWFWALGAIWLSYIPVFVKEVLRSGSDTASLFLFIFSIGIGMGSILIAKIQKGQIRSYAVPWGGWGITVGMILFIIIQSIPHEGDFQLRSLYGFLVCGALGWIGFFGGIFSVPLYAILQSCSEPSHRARNIATNNLFNALFMVSVSVVAMIMGLCGWSGIPVLLLMTLGNVAVSIWIRKLESTLMDA